MALIARTRCGLLKVRVVRPGSGVAIIAPASPFDRAGFDKGLSELERIGLRPVHDDSVFEREAIVAGSAAVRVAALTRAWHRDDVDAVMAVRGGYGSMELLPGLDAGAFAARPMALVGYSDITALHTWLNGHVGMTSVHGAMIDARIAHGPEAYDPDTLLRSLGGEPMGELTAAGLEVLRPGEASGPIVGGTLTQLAASLGTPWDFRPPDGAVLFLEDVTERPYRLRRLLTQLRQAGRFERATAVVFGQMPGCDESDGRVTARSVIHAFFEGFAGPILFGFPSGHTTTPLVSVPFGVHARVVASGIPRLVIEEAAAAE